MNVSNDAPIRAGVLTVSDRCARGELTDASGPAVAEALRETFNADLVASACVADEADAIARQLAAWAGESPAIDLLLTTGGTGLAPRDVTPEATAQVLERRHPGLLELARLRCYEKTPLTFLSRGEAGTIGRTLVINLPGSPHGAVQMVEALADVLPHAIETLRGADHVSDDG